MISTSMAVILGATAFGICLIIAMKFLNNPANKSKYGKWSIRQKYHPIHNPSPKQRELEHKRSLETYEKLWQLNENDKKVKRELALLHLAESNKKSLETDAEKLFISREVRQFFRDHIVGKPFFTSNALAAIVEILQLLDTKGKISSVVNKNADEPEIGYEPSIYNALKRITLREHSINVALEMLKFVKQENPRAPKVVITALLHDIGKITKYYDRLHVTGTHPFIALSAVESLTAIKKLSYLDEILDAVKNHHRIPESLLGKELKKADQAARRLEILELEIDSEPSDSQIEVIPENNALKNEDRLSDQPIGVTYSANKKKTGTKPKAVADLLGTGGVSTGKPDVFGEASCTPHMKDVDLMGAGSFHDNHQRGKNLAIVNMPWFEIGKLLHEINPVINRMLEGRWYALSQEEGTVYVRPDLLFSIAAKMCNDPVQIQIAQTDLETQDNIIYSMVSKCRKEGIIENTMLSKKYYGALFLINPGSRNEYEAYLIPFRAEAWKNDYMNFEQRKSKQMYSIKEIKPKFVLESSH